MRGSRWIVVVVAASALTGCGGGSVAVRTVEPAAPTTASSTPPEPAPITSTAATDATVPSVPAAATEFVMPNEVGKVLQVAQDDIQATSGNPIYFTTSSDATGAGRAQILDSGWQVCRQSVAPGAQVSEGEPIDFAVVKLDETCP